jgi:hypothetical protein
MNPDIYRRGEKMYTTEALNKVAVPNGSGGVKFVQVAETNFDGHKIISSSSESIDFNVFYYLPITPLVSDPQVGVDDKKGLFFNGQQIANLTPQELLDLSNQNEAALATINSSRMRPSPDSPQIIKFYWHGHSIDYDALVLELIYTRVVTNDSLPVTTPLYLYTKDVAQITPTITGVTGNAKSIGADVETVMGTSAPVFDYSNPSVKHLMTWTGFDPSLVVQLNLISEGVLELGSLSAYTALTQLYLNGNSFIDSPIIDVSASTLISQVRFHQITDVEQILGTAGLTLCAGFTCYLCPKLTHIDPPNSPNIASFFSYTNPLMTSIGRFINTTSLTTILATGCALDQTTVDTVLNDMQVNNMIGGSINLSGGTSAKRTLSSLDAYNQLITDSNTITVNGLESTENSLLWFKTKDVASVTPTIQSVEDGDWVDNEGQLFEASNAPTFTFGTPANEHLVSMDNVDPSTVVNILLSNDGVTEVSEIGAEYSALSLFYVDANVALTALKAPVFLNSQFITRFCSSLATITGTESLDFKPATYWIYNCALVGVLPMPAFVGALTSLRGYSNAGVTSLRSLVGELLLTEVDLNGCALDQTTVDTVLNDMQSNSMTSGAIDLSGGTSAKRTLSSLDAYNQLIVNLNTVTDNGIESTENSPIWFKTVDVASISPRVQGNTETGDWVDNEGQLYETVAVPTFTFGTPANEHLISHDNIIPSDLFRIDFSSCGITEVHFDPIVLTNSFWIFDNPLTEISGMEDVTGAIDYFFYSCPNLETLALAGGENSASLQFYNCASLTTMTGTETFTGITTGLFGFSCNLTGQFTVPIAPNSPIFRIPNNPLLTSLTTFIGCVSLTELRVENCGLDLATIDMIYNDMAANGMSSGFIDTTGGTNAIPSPATISGAILTLTNAGVTCVYNT